MQLSRYASRITGTGSAFPKRSLHNEELSRTIDTTDEWIRERTGISERRIMDPKDPNERNSSLAYRAALQALEMAGKHPEEIDQILFATCSPDLPMPSSACLLQEKLKARKAWALDLNAVCSGFVFALAVADQFIQTGQVKTSLVIGSDVLSTMTNWKDRSSCILFGDGAGAVVVERTEAGSSRRILSHHLRSDGSEWDYLFIETGGSNQETTEEHRAQGLDKMRMKGKEIFKSAVKTLSELTFEALQANGLKLEDLDWMLPHQANLRILEATAKRVGLPMDRVLVNLKQYGNTSAATVPALLDEAVRDGRIRENQLLLLNVFGAGLTSGSLLLRWG